MAEKWSILFRKPAYNALAFESVQLQFTQSEVIKMILFDEFEEKSIILFKRILL